MTVATAFRRLLVSITGVLGRKLSLKWKRELGQADGKFGSIGDFKEVLHSAREVLTILKLRVFITYIV